MVRSLAMRKMCENEREYAGIIVLKAYNVFKTLNVQMNITNCHNFSKTFRILFLGGLFQAWK